MTDNVTLDTVRETEAMLQSYLEGLERTLHSERSARTSERELIRDTAVQYGRDHGCIEDVDALLLRIGLRPSDVRLDSVLYVVHVREALPCLPRNLRNEQDEDWRVGAWALGSCEDTPVITYDHRMTANMGDFERREGDYETSSDACYCAELEALPADTPSAIASRMSVVTRPGLTYTYDLIHCGQTACSRREEFIRSHY